MSATPSNNTFPRLEDAPHGPPPGWSVDVLKSHLYAGMHIELSTIPIYLCAMYSIKQDNSTKGGTTARVKMLDVAQQEMLHLALVGNMYHAAGGDKKLYSTDFVFSYPYPLLYQNIQLELAAATKKNLETFVKIESPYMQMPGDPAPGPNPIQPNPDGSLSKYKSIGEFYEELERGIKLLWEGDGKDIRPDKELFKRGKGKQFDKTEFFPKCGVVDDLDSALAALELIVDEGEGGAGVDESHYQVFVDLHEQRKDWEHFDLIDKPSTSAYSDYPMLQHLSLAFNAAYCYLLLIIDTCWDENAQAYIRIQHIRNIHAVMIEAITPLAALIMKQKVGDKHAAPCFEYYPPDRTVLEMQPLFDAIKEQLQTAQSLARDEDSKADISRIQFSVDRIAPPK
ncbi:hypothetical protein CPB86DRAFT_522877 [Serendipita vermifera]|nr:hypothetical protein CPB86DRAFT_522877 [Serendipita vermifera]